MPSPIHCLEEIHTLLPIIAREKNTALLDELTTAVKKLSHSPETVEEFVEHLEFQKTVRNSQWLSHSTTTSPRNTHQGRMARDIVTGARVAVTPDASVRLWPGRRLYLTQDGP